MKDPKKFAKEKLMKRAPKGVDPEKHERCVRDVKRQGHSVGSAHAICTSSMKKAEHKDKLPGGLGDKKKPKDFDSKQLAVGIKVEMEHTNDRTLAQEIAMDHLTEDPKYYTKLKQIEKADGSIPCGTGLPGQICRHNKKKLHDFVSAKKSRMSKSIDFKETLVSVDSKDQLLAETTTNPALLDYIQKNAVDGAKIPFPTGILTLSQREPGLFHGMFSDRDGQVVEKFDSQTVAIIAKNLQLKSLVPIPEKSMDAQIIASEPSVPASEQEVKMLAAAHDRIDMVHNRIDALQRQVIEQVKGKSIRIKYGDFELEIKKSIQGFVSDFKAGRALPDKDIVRKALSSWRKKHSEYMALHTEQAAARELIENWEQHQDSFCQFVDALSRGEDEQD